MQKTMFMQYLCKCSIMATFLEGLQDFIKKKN